MKVYLHDPAFTLGDTTFSVEESVSASRTLSSAEVLCEAGFKTHHICSPETGVQELAASTASQLGEREGAGRVEPGSHRFAAAHLLRLQRTEKRGVVGNGVAVLRRRRGTGALFHGHLAALVFERARRQANAQMEQRS